MATETVALSVDDQDYYPLHEEDDVPEIPRHRVSVTDIYNGVRAYGPAWFVTSNACIYWERGNTRDYVAPDLFVVKEPLTEPVHRVYQTWKQPVVAFVMEVGSRSTFRRDSGPKLQVYALRVRAQEYLYANPPRGVLRLWRLGENGYVEVSPLPNGRLLSEQLGLEFALDDTQLRAYTPDGELLLTHEEMALELEETEQRLEETEQRLEEAQQRAKLEAEQRAELERQLAELRASLVNRNDN